MNTKYFFLHGFLGSSQDWGSGSMAADWLTDPRMNRASNWSELADAVNDWALENSSEGTRKILVGYSMGGRIALHAALENPGFWDAAVIISSHPGLKTESERQARIDHDRQWAQRFRSENWNSLMSDWNAQPVFSQEANPLDRPESPEMRETLARALENFSLGKQKDLRSDLASATLPILWMAGQKDQKYAELASECASLNPRFEFAAIPGAGHRAPWTARNSFESILKNWTDNFSTNNQKEYTNEPRKLDQNSPL